MLACTVAGAVVLLAAAASPESRDEVLAAEDARFTAMTAADAAALGGMLADDLLYVHTSARAETKDEFIEAIDSGAIRYVAFVPSERRVVLLDECAAIVQGRADARVVTGGDERSFEVRYIAVYGRAAARWQLRAWQTTRIP